MKKRIQARCAARRLALGEPLELRLLLSANSTAIDTNDIQGVAGIISSALDSHPSGKTTPIYMKYGTITGDVTTKGFVGDIQLNSFLWGLSRPTTPDPSGGLNPSTPAISDILVGKDLDSSSVALIQQAFVGTGKSVEIDFVQTGGRTPDTYLKIQLQDALISGYEMSSSGGTPGESLALDFAAITVQDDAGNSAHFSIGGLGATLVPATPQALGDDASDGDPIYMKYGSITGDVMTKGFTGFSQLNSFDWGVSRAINSSVGEQRENDREPGAPSVSEVHITKGFDSATVPLLQEAFTGTGQKVSIDFVTGTKAYLSFSFEGVLISADKLVNSGKGLTESLSLNFTKISVDQVVNKTDNTFSYDLLAAGGTIHPTAEPAADNADDGDPIFMQFGNIKGDVTTKGATGDINVSTFQWGVTRTLGTRGTGGAGSAPSVSEITVTKTFDIASVPLIGAAAIGQIDHAQFDLANISHNTSVPYLTIALDDALISSYTMSSAGGTPVESLSLNFTRIRFTHVPPKGPTQEFTVGVSPIGGSADVVLAPPPPTPGDPIYMKYGDIKGDVQSKGFVGLAQLASFSWGLSRSVSVVGGQRGIGPLTVDEAAITKTFDSSSIGLMNAAVDPNPATVLNNFVDNGKAYLQITLDQTFVSSYAMSSGGATPTESLSLNFAHITIATAINHQPAQVLDIAVGQVGATVVPAPAVAGAASGTPANTIYMQYGQITGDVTTKGAIGAIAVNSLAWGISRSIEFDTQGNRRIGSPTVMELSLAKSFDSATVPLLQQAVSNKPSDVMINFDNVSHSKGAVPYLSIHLGDTFVSSDKLTSTGQAPAESLTLNYDFISVTAIDPKGNTSAFSFTISTRPGVVETPGLQLAGDGVSPPNDPIYMKYGQINGDVTTPGFEKFVGLNSFQFSISRTIHTIGIGRGPGTPVISDILITKGFDVATVPLMGEALDGEGVETKIAFVATVKKTPTAYLTISLQNALIDAYSLNGGTDIVETLSLDFTRITFAATNAAGQVQVFIYNSVSPT